MARRVACSPNGTTSIGSGKRPSTGTHLDPSAMTIMRAEAAATIFSRNSAPPPPLIRARSGPISSAPSTVRSSAGASSSVVKAMPRSSAWRRVASDVGTPTTSSPACTRSPRSATKCTAVEPEPSPSRIPGSMKSSARAAAWRFCVSASIGVDRSDTGRAKARRQVLYAPMRKDNPGCPLCPRESTASHAFAMSSPVIAFDLDGTLVNTAPDLICTLNAVFADKGIPPVGFDDARAMIGGGVKALIERGLAAQGMPYTPADLDQLYKIYLERYSAHIADHSRPFPGLALALDRMASQGFRFAVCTNKLEWLSVRLLDALDLSWRFAAICGQDTFGIAKPDPDMLRRTVLRAGGQPAGAIMVGDSATDIDTARAAGVPVIAVDFGYTEIPVTLLGADRIISHFEELSAAVDDLIA